MDLEDTEDVWESGKWEDLDSPATRRSDPNAKREEDCKESILRADLTSREADHMFLFMSTQESIFQEELWMFARREVQ